MAEAKETQSKEQESTASQPPLEGAKETLNLLSSLAVSSGAGSANVLKYPNETIEKHSDYVKFQFYVYDGPFGGNQGQKYEKKPDIDGDRDAYAAVLSKDLQRYNQSNKQYTIYPGSKNVILYMPEDIQAQYGARWGGKEFSNIGAEAMKGAGGVMTGDIGQSFNAIGQLIKNATGALPTAAAQGLADAINATGAGDVTTNDVLSGSVGVVLNPNTELMFSGFDLRTFTMRFKLVPRNETEAGIIQQIIGQFKKVSLPTFGQSAGGLFDVDLAFKKAFTNENDKPKVESGDEKKAEDGKQSPPANADTTNTEAAQNLGASNANYIGVPGLCQVKFMKGSGLHPWLPQYKLCAITGIDVNYTPDGVFATYHDGSPVAYELNLSFSETKLVYAQDISLTGVSY